MELRNKIEFSVKNENMECILQCTNESSLGFIYDSLSQMKDYIVKAINDSADKTKSEVKNDEQV